MKIPIARSALVQKERGVDGRRLESRDVSEMGSWERH